MQAAFAMSASLLERAGWGSCLLFLLHTKRAAPKERPFLLRTSIYAKIEI